MKRPTWKLEQRKLEELLPYEFNPRNITEKGRAELKRSIDKFGLAEPIIINLDNVIIGGHARYFVLLERAEKFCDCYAPNFLLSPEEMKELNIRLNKNIAGEWDFDVLANSFELPDLLDWGFEKYELGMPDIEFSDPPDTVQENVEHLKKIKEQRRKGNEEIIGKTDTEKYLVIVFTSREEKIKLLKKLHLSEDERYLPSTKIEIKKIGNWKIEEKAASSKKAGSQG